MAIEAVALNAPTRLSSRRLKQLTVSASTCSGIVPTVENSLVKEKLSNVQMASVLEQFVSVTQ